MQSDSLNNVNKVLDKNASIATCFSEYFHIVLGVPYNLGYIVDGCVMTHDTGICYIAFICNLT